MWSISTNKALLRLQETHPSLNFALRELDIEVNKFLYCIKRPSLDKQWTDEPPTFVYLCQIVLGLHCLWINPVKTGLVVCFEREPKTFVINQTVYTWLLLLFTQSQCCICHWGVKNCQTFWLKRKFSPTDTCIYNRNFTWICIFLTMP
jgi:hypothetical protein